MLVTSDATEADFTGNFPGEEDTSSESEIYNALFNLGRASVHLHYSIVYNNTSDSNNSIFAAQNVIDIIDITALPEIYQNEAAIIMSKANAILDEHNGNSSVHERDTKDFMTSGLSDKHDLSDKFAICDEVFNLGKSSIYLEYAMVGVINSDYYNSGIAAQTAKDLINLKGIPDIYKMVAIFLTDNANGILRLIKNTS